MSRSLTLLPNNTNTSQIAEVYTASGFNAGDLVYYQGGDYKSAPNLSMPNNVVFNNTVNLNASTLLGNAAVSSTFTTTVSTPTGSTGGRFAAVLTNGNIVQAFVNTGPTPGAGTSRGIYFRIVNASGVVQVAPTQVGSDTITYSYTLDVVALTGGGFAVVYIDGTPQIRYAIYTNTGSLTTAVTTDSGITVNVAQRIRATRLANGGFAIAAHNSSTGFTSIRSYGATGTAAYAWVSTGITPSSTEASFGLSSRSDSSTIVAFVTTSNRVSYYLYNSSGTLITSNFFGITTPATATVDVACLADGTTYVIGYYNALSPTLPAFRLLPSGNSMGSQIAIPAANFNTGNSTVNTNASMSLLAQSSGGFVMVFADYFNTLAYAFFNSSGTAVSGTNGSGTLPITIPVARSAYNYYVTLVEISGFVNMYWTLGVYTQNQSSNNQSFAQINSTTYALVPQVTTTTGVLGSATVAAGAAAVAAATPTNTKFYPAATSTSSSTQDVGAVVLAPTAAATFACNGIASCTLPNGQFVIAYMRQSAPYDLYASVYSSAGVLITTITVGVSGVASLNAIRVAALSSGKFVVGYISSSNVYSVKLYSSTYTQIGTEQFETMYTTFSSMQYNFDIAGLGGGSDRYAVAQLNPSGYPSYSIYDNTNTRIVSQTVLVANSSYYNVRIAADPVGGFGVSIGSSGGTSHLGVVLQTGPTTYSITQTNYQQFSSITGGNQQSSLIYANNGYYQAVTLNGSASQGFHVPTGSSVTTNLSYGNLLNQVASNINSYTQALGLNGNGHVIYVGYQTSTTVNLYVIFGGVSFTTGASSPITSFPTNYSSSLAAPTNAASTACCFTISPSTGNNFILAWLNDSNLPTFAIYNALALTTSFTVTAGVTQSNTASIQPTASTANSTVPNTVFAGVAVTGAAAASTGQVAINGLAQLNSNYPIGTSQAFDYTGQAIDGVKGVINGRVVNMQGNS